MSRTTLISMLFLLGACTADPVDPVDDTNGSADADGDGLTDDEEVALGLDPTVADSDGDGLLDGDELSGDPVYGFVSDPLLADTDGDSYLDGWEVAEGTDPNERKDRIYQGFWPYNPDKDNLSDPGFQGPLWRDMKMYRHKAKDQYGERVDLYDFAKGTDYVVVDIAHEWCGPCYDIAGWLATGDNADFETYFGQTREWVHDGTVQWITILGQDVYGRPTEVANLERWDQFFPIEGVPVLADPNGEADQAIASFVLPGAVLLDRRMNVVAAGHPFDIMDVLQDRLAAE